MAVIRTQMKKAHFAEIRLQIKAQTINLAFIIFAAACARVNISDVISPFAPALVAASLIHGHKQWQIALGVGLGYLSAAFSLPISALLASAVIFGAGFLLRRRYAVKARTMLAVLLAGMLAAAAVFRSGSIYTLLFGVIDAILSVIFYIAFVNILNVLKNRPAAVLNDEQLIAAALCLCVPVIGLGGAEILGCRLAYIFAACLTILAGYLCGGAGSVCGTLFGLAASFTTGNMLIIGNMAMGGLAAGMMRKLKRPASALGFVTANILMTVYVSGEGAPTLSLQEALTAAILIHLIPGKTLIQAGKSLDSGIKRANDEKYYLSRMKNLTIERLHDISGVFSQMAEMFTGVGVTAGEAAAVSGSAAGFIREQLSGTSEVIDRLAGELDIDIRFKQGIEEDVVRRLQAKGVTPSQILAQDRAGQTEIHVVLPVSGESEPDERLARECVSKAARRQMELKGQARDIGGRRRVFIYEPKKTLDVRIAHAQRAKEGICGDSFADTRLTDGRHIICLGDGMGFGERAAHESFCTVSLIQNLYKAGFGEDIIYSNINELLRLSAPDEMFSTVDICVIDLVNASAVLTKLGAAPSYLRRNGRLKAIGRESLPMGILEDVHSATSRHTLKDGDALIMMTDGIWDRINDSPRNVLELNALLEHKLTPQAMADCVMEYALGIDTDVEYDDMTVLAVDVIG